MKHSRLTAMLTALLVAVLTLSTLPSCGKDLEPEPETTPDTTPSTSDDSETNNPEITYNPFTGYYKWTATDNVSCIVWEIKQNQCCEHILKPKSFYIQHITSPYLIAVAPETGLTAAYNLEEEKYELWKWEFVDDEISKIAYPSNLAAYGNEFNRDTLRKILTDYAVKNLTPGSTSTSLKISDDEFFTLLRNLDIEDYDIGMSPIANKLKGCYSVVSNRNYDLFEMEFDSNWRYKDKEYIESGKVSPQYTGKFSISDNKVVIDAKSNVAQTTGATSFRVKFLETNMFGQTTKLTLTANNGTTLTLENLGQ